MCFLIHGLSIGGMERVMSELAIYFSAKPELEIHLILYGRKRKLLYSIPGNIIIHKPGFKFHDKARLYSTLRTLFFIRHTVKTILPSTVLSFGEYWNNLVLLSLIGLKFPVFISDRSRPGKDLGAFHNILRRLLYRRAAGYIAQTSHAANIASEKKWNKNIKVIGNPVRQIISPDINIEKEKIILSVGRLINTKHFDRLIKLFVEINDRDWKLVIVGGNAIKQNNYETLTRLIETLHADNYVFLEGYQSNIDYYYRKSQIFAFMSSSEGFPNVILEALYAGLPVVSYDCIAGPSEMIVNGENGFLIPLFDDVEFGKKVKLLIRDKDLRMKMSQNAYESIKRHSIQNIGEEFYHFIKDGDIKNKKYINEQINHCI